MIRPAGIRTKWPWILLGLILTALALTFCYVNTRTTQITVEVRDADTGAALEGALVEVQNNNGQTLFELHTDEFGVAGVKRLDPAKGYRVLVRKVDYIPALGTDLEVRLHKTTEVRVPLRPKPGGRLYVGAEQNQIAMVDTASYLLASLSRGPEALRQGAIRHLVAPPELPQLYVAARSATYLLDAARLEPLQGWSVTGSVEGLGLSQDGARLFAHVTARPRPRLTVIDPQTGDMRSLDIDPLPELAPDAALALRDKRLSVVGGLLVAEDAEGQVSVYWIADVARRAGAAYEPTWAALSADQSLLYVGGPEMGGVAALQLETQAPAQLAELGQGLSAIAVNPNGREIYLANRTLGTLLVLDAQTLESLAVVPAGRAPEMVAVDAEGARVYVGNTDSQNVTIVDVASRRVIQTVEIGAQPYALVVR